MALLSLDFNQNATIIIRQERAEKPFRGEIVPEYMPKPIIYQHNSTKVMMFYTIEREIKLLLDSLIKFLQCEIEAQMKGQNAVVFMACQINS